MKSPFPLKSLCITLQAIRFSYFRTVILLVISLVLAAALPHFSLAIRQTPQADGIRDKSQKPDAVSGEILTRFRNGAMARTKTAETQILTVNGGREIALRSSAPSAMISIADKFLPMNSADDANPIDDTETFVAQHYRDFLNREPDTAGLQFWMDNINSCGSELVCREVKRIDTSAAYFQSIEFQETGYLVHRFYKTSLERRPLFSEFLTDTQAIGEGVVVNSPGWRELLDSNKEAFANAWVTRPAFASLYNNVSNAQYVDRLISNTGATFTQTDRNAMVDVLDSQVMTRAKVLHIIADDLAFYNLEYNAAFVEMQYFGYLRRNPQDAPDNNLDGYNFWLGKLNEFGDFRRAEMVKAFLVSEEYRQRFGSP